MTLKTDLYQHQRQADEKLSKIKVSALYMEMGTGKTRTALELISQRYPEKVNHILWLCPCSVRPTIKAELEKHVDGDTSMFTVYGIESLSSSDRLYLQLLQLAQTRNLYLIVDESNLVKNPKAIRTQRIIELAKLCKYKLILNGTPISKCEADLFAQWYVLDWRILGYQSYWSFAANHLEYDEKIPGKINRVLEVDYLVRKIAPYTFQVKKSECLDLPEKTYTARPFWLTDEQEEYYRLTMDEFLMQLDEMHPSTIYRLFTALQHVTSGRVVTTPAHKRMRTADIFDNPKDNPRIETLLNVLDRIDDKVIIWCKYTHEIETISKILKEQGKTVVEFYGEISRKKREANAEKFSQDAQYFIANKTCAGYGLNLQFCSYMIYYSNDWDWATRSQSEDRVHRMGQKRNVHIIDIYAKETIDGRILDCLNRKENLVDQFKGSISKMQKEDIRKWINDSHRVESGRKEQADK